MDKSEKNAPIAEQTIEPLLEADQTIQQPEEGLEVRNATIEEQHLEESPQKSDAGFEPTPDEIQSPEMKDDFQEDNEEVREDHDEGNLENEHLIDEQEEQLTHVD